MEHDPWVTLFLPHSLLRTRGVRALPTVDRAPLYKCHIHVRRACPQVCIFNVVTQLLKLLLCCASMFNIQSRVIFCWKSRSFLRLEFMASEGEREVSVLSVKTLSKVKAAKNIQRHVRGWFIRSKKRELVRGGSYISLTVLPISSFSNNFFYM